MPKRRSTIPIAHADPDDVPMIAFTDEEWEEEIEHAYGRKLQARPPSQENRPHSTVDIER